MFLVINENILRIRILIIHLKINLCQVIPRDVIKLIKVNSNERSKNLTFDADLSDKTENIVVCANRVHKTFKRTTDNRKWSKKIS